VIEDVQSKKAPVKLPVQTVPPNQATEATVVVPDEPHIHDDANTFHWFSPGMYVLYAIAFGFMVWWVKRRVKRKET